MIKDLKVNKYFLGTVLFLIPLIHSGALDNPESFVAGINNAKETYYSGNATEEAVSLLANLKDALNQSSVGSSDIESKRRLSETLLLEGLLLGDMGNESRASDVLSEGIDFCERQYSENGDLFFLVQGALLKSHWMLLQKTSVLIRTGGEIQDMTDMALENNPDDFTARLLSAQGLINAPALFGGNPEEATRLLISSESLIRDKFDTFDLYLTLADSRRKKKAWDDANEWCGKALSLFPENIKALEMQDLIKRKKK